MTGSASRHGAYGLGLVEVKGPEVGHVLGPPPSSRHLQPLCGEDAADEALDDTLWAPLTSTIVVMKPKLHAAREPYDWQHYPTGLPNLD
jgi:hypothetical protein